MPKQNKSKDKGQVEFIGRIEELTQIDKLIENQRKTRKFGFLIISGAGGHGKTRLLNEIFDRYAANSTVHMQNILDFDDPALHLPENVTIRIAEQLNPSQFEPYLQKLKDFKKIQTINVSREQLKELKVGVETSFVDSFNRITATKLVVLRFDTTDALKGRSGGLEDFIKLGKRLENTLVIIAGRDAERFNTIIEKALKLPKIEKILLSQLPLSDSEKYLARKQKIMSMPTLEPRVAQTLLHLSNGNPILLDLAMEWRSRGIKLDPMFENRLELFNSLPEDEKKELCRDFEKELVRKIAATTAEIHWIFLLMAWVFPIDERMLALLRDISDKEAQKLLKEAQTYIFVKQLPNDRFKLHDEMHRMIEAYVWPEVDRDRSLRREFSSRAVKYFQVIIKELKTEISLLEEQVEDKTINADQKVALLANLDEKERKLWEQREQLLRHMLNIDISEGLILFEKIYEAASIDENIAFRRQFINIVEENRKHLTDKQLPLLNFYKADQLFLETEYESSHKQIKVLLEQQKLPIDLKIKCFKLMGNIKIRQGKFEDATKDFIQAVDLSKTSGELIALRIQSTNALGWAYQEAYDQENALKFLKEARWLYQMADEKTQDVLKTDYGYILNNLMVLLSENDQTRKAAINMANSAILYWKEIGNEIGLGMGYTAQGTCYHQTDHSEHAFKAFQNALDIFEPLGLNDWISEILSWRGTLYHNIGRHKEAERDLNRSLKTGYERNRIMTLNRLGRVHMALKNWDKAQEYMEESLKKAQDAPDYKYWIMSVSRLIIIAAKKGQMDRLGYFTNLLDECLEKIKAKIQRADENAEGVGHLGLAEMALLQNKSENISFICECLEQGITQIVSYGSWARRDVVRRLGLIEEDFYQIDPGIIQGVGKHMVDFIYKKEQEDISYSTALEIMIKWKNWQGKGSDLTAKSKDADLVF